MRFTSPSQVSESSSVMARSLLLGFLARHGCQPILRAKLNGERAFLINLLCRFLHATHARFSVIGDQHQVLRYCYAGNDEVWLIDAEFRAGYFLAKLLRVLLVIEACLKSQLFSQTA
jgi:hypothetical protein